jgi:hypothetical protein
MRLGKRRPLGDTLRIGKRSFGWAEKRLALGDSLRIGRRADPEWVDCIPESLLFEELNEAQVSHRGKFFKRLPWD